MRLLIARWIHLPFTKKGETPRVAEQTSRARWNAVKNAALASGNTAVIEAVRCAEENALEALIENCGRAAALFPTNEQLDEMSSHALRMFQTVEGQRIWK
jgi:hypothetical protein